MTTSLPAPALVIEHEEKESPIIWPKSLVAEIAERRCIIILGAGASASCVSNDGKRRPKDWKSFLEAALQLVSNLSVKELIKELLEKGNYLDAAQIIYDAVNKADFSDFLKEEFEFPNYLPSEIHKLVHLIDPKIVITPNYDQIYERYCTVGDAKQGYNTCRHYEEHGLNDIRSSTRVILKVHGCVSNPDKIVLTRGQYFAARNDYPNFYKILDSLFLTNTLLFIGCGLNDPDINLILENVNIAAKTSRPHYALVSKGRVDSIKRVIRETNNIELLEYGKGKHEQVIFALRELLELVIQYRITHVS